MQIFLNLIYDSKNLEHYYKITNKQIPRILLEKNIQIRTIFSSEDKYKRKCFPQFEEEFHTFFLNSTTNPKSNPLPFLKEFLSGEGIKFESPITRKPKKKKKFYKRY